MAITPSISGLPSLNILAVEDDPAVAYAVAAALRNPGCNVTVASGVEEAFSAVDRQPGGFDVVVTDNNMPVASGGELVRRLRQSKFNGKIVVLSAYVSPQQEAEFRQHGVNIILRKPFSVAELRGAVGL